MSFVVCSRRFITLILASCRVCDPSRNPWIASRILPTKGYLNLHGRWCLRQRYHHRERSTISPLADAGNRHVQISEPVYIRIRETVAAAGSPNFGGCSGRPSWSVHAGRRCSVGRLARRGRMHRRRGCDASSLKMVGGWDNHGFRFTNLCNVTMVVSYCDPHAAEARWACGDNHFVTGRPRGNAARTTRSTARLIPACPSARSGWRIMKGGGTALGGVLRSSFDSERRRRQLLVQDRNSSPSNRRT